MDQIDIHALYDQLHDGEGIMPGDAGPIKRLVPLLSAVDWPEELAEEATALVDTLSQLAAALADNDLETALPLSETAHDEQHHFSGSVSEWFDKLMMRRRKRNRQTKSRTEKPRASATAIRMATATTATTMTTTAMVTATEISTRG